MGGKEAAALVPCSQTHMYPRKRYCRNLRAWPEFNPEMPEHNFVDPSPILFRLETHLLSVLRNAERMVNN